MQEAPNTWSTSTKSDSIYSIGISDVTENDNSFILHGPGFYSKELG
jgi:hypothetical protein